MFETEFGFLSDPHALESPDFIVKPVADHSGLSATLREAAHVDGFYYPPMSHQVTVDPWSGDVGPPLARTARPALTYQLPASHSLIISNPVDSDPLGGDAHFLVQMLAAIYGRRLQVGHWLLEGRIPVDRPTHPVWVTSGAASRLLGTAYERWRSERPDIRRRITNTLYLHAKAPCYEWLWEQFFLEYLVTDAIYDWLARGSIAVSVPHAERIRELCGRLGVWCPPEAPVDELVALRNELFHEARFFGHTPGYHASQHTFDTVADLRDLNHRLILASLAGPSAYVHSPWIRGSRQFQILR